MKFLCAAGGKSVSIQLFRATIELVLFQEGLENVSGLPARLRSRRMSACRRLISVSSLGICGKGSQLFTDFQCFCMSVSFLVDPG